MREQARARKERADLEAHRAWLAEMENAERDHAEALRRWQEAREREARNAVTERRRAEITPTQA